MPVGNYGRKRHTPKPTDVHLDRIVEKAGITLTPPKEPFGHANTYPHGGWFMNGNGPYEPGEETLPSSWGAVQQGAGDCVAAAEINEEKVALTDAGMAPDEAHKLVGDVVASINLYTAVGAKYEGGGYDPQTGNNDNGLEIRDRLEFMQKVGRKRHDGTVHKIGPYAKVDVKNLPLLLFAIKHFEACPAGVEVTDQNEAAFEAATQDLVGEFRHPIWDAAGSVMGLHCIPLVGRPNSTHIAALTWCFAIDLTEAYREQRMEEAWVYITSDRYNKVTGKTYEGDPESALLEYLSAL